LTVVEDIGKLKDFNKKRTDAVNKSINSLNTAVSTLQKQLTINMFQTSAHGLLGGTDELVPKFYGQKAEDFNSWIDIFELTSNAYGFDDDRKAKILPAYLRETALHKYKALTEDTRKDYKEMVKQLKEALKPAEQKRWAQGRLAEIKQNDEESVQAFALKLQKLVKLAHPELTQEQRNGTDLLYKQTTSILETMGAGIRMFII